MQLVIDRLNLVVDDHYLERRGAAGGGAGARHPAKEAKDRCTFSTCGQVFNKKCRHGKCAMHCYEAGGLGISCFKEHRGLAPGTCIGCIRPDETDETV